MAETGHRTGETVGDVPRWLDALTALWMIVASAAFTVKILLDAGIVPPTYNTIAVAGRYSYAVMIGGCLIGSGLALARKFTRRGYNA